MSSLEEPHRSPPRPKSERNTYCFSPFEHPEGNVTMNTKPIITGAELDSMLGAALTEAGSLGLAATIALVDDGGYALRLHRTDGAGLMTPTVALAKARTAALMRAPSGALTARLKDEPELLRLTEYLPMPGGQPIRHDGVCVGGIGVSGGNPAQDEAIAQAGLDALKAA
jgi:glc operon protein GlcG